MYNRNEKLPSLAKPDRVAPDVSEVFPPEGAINAGTGKSYRGAEQSRLTMSFSPKWIGWTTVPRTRSRKLDRRFGTKLEHLETRHVTYQRQFIAETTLTFCALRTRDRVAESLHMLWRNRMTWSQSVEQTMAYG